MLSTKSFIFDNETRKVVFPNIMQTASSRIFLIKTGCVFSFLGMARSKVSFLYKENADQIFFFERVATLTFFVCFHRLQCCLC